MALEIGLHPAPPDNTGYKTSFRYEETRNLDEFPPLQRPWILGEIYQARGWLEGLDGSPLSGWLELVLHEQLTTVNGKISVYDEATRHSLLVMLGMMNRIAHGICAQYPTTRFRIKLTYKLKWLS